MVVLNMVMWSQGSRVPSYDSKEDILNLEGRGWLVIDTMKGESVLWTRSSIWFAFLMESFISSMAFFIWSISLSRCGSLRMTVPLDWSPPLTSFPSLPFFEFFPCSLTHRCQRCLLTSLVNSWFCCVKFAIVATMDCSCCWTGADGDFVAWFGWLKAFPLSWCSRLMAIDLVQTMQPFCLGKQGTQQLETLLTYPQTMPTDDAQELVD